MNPVLESLYAQRTALLDEIETIARAVSEGDGRDLSETEQSVITRQRARIDDVLDPQIDQWEAVERTRAADDARIPTSTRPGTTVAVRDEPESDVYRTYAEYARDVLISRYDQIAQRSGMPRGMAEQRIDRVMANTLSSDVAGLIRPQYLDQIAQLIDASRPVVASARKVGLVSGKLSYPSVTQKPIVGKQTTEKTEAPSQKMTVVFVDVIADTYVGAGDLSWQTINWSTPDALGLWFDLAAEQYAWQTEAATGTVLAAATAQATPALPATPTLPDWIASIMAASAAIYAASRRRPDTIYADVASGYSIMGLVSNVSPNFLPGGSFSITSGQGSVAGLRLVISAGLPAKTVVVGQSSALLVAETSGAPVELRAVEPALGGMEVGIIGAFVSKITDGGGFRKLTIP